MKHFFFALLLLCPFAAYAQTASVGGAVQDPSGAVIPKAHIEFRNQDTGVRRQSVSNGDGIYRIDALDPGKYDATVQSPGFKTLTKENVVFHVADQVRLDFRMQVGEASQHVDVDAGGMQMNTTDAAVGTVVDRKFVENMPLNGRSFQDLISMTPGIVNQSPQATGTQLLGASGDFSVNGQRTQSNNYIVDGVSANIGAGYASGIGQSATGGTVSGGTALGTTQTLVSVDALQEFRVQSSTYSSEYGRSPGGQFSLGTRSGTNALHGGIFDYLRNNYFDANDWFNDHYGTAIPALRQNDFGGTVGGPIRIPHLYNGESRSFFFVSYEGLRLTQPTASTIQYVPDLFMRQQAIAAVRPIFNAFPLPTGIDYGTAASPSLAQFIAPFSLPSSIDSTSVRLDHTVSPKLALFFRFSETPSSAVARPNLARTTTSSDASTYTVGATDQISPNLTDEFRLGYSRADETMLSKIDNFGGATPIDLVAAVGGSAAATEPFILLDISGLGNTLFGQPYGGSAGRQWNLVDTLSLTVGHHHLKMGVDYRRIKTKLMPPTSEPYAGFESTTSMLAGAPEVTIFVARKAATPIFVETALFIQDEWRPHPKLSLSFGMRWDDDPAPTEQHGDDAYTVLGSVTNPSSLQLAPQGTPLWKTGWFNFAPRLGAAWTVRQSPGSETVLRAGGGVFYDTANDIAALGYSSLGFFADTYGYGVTIPYNQSELNVPLTVKAPYNSAAIIAFPTHLQLPYTLEWNVSLQQAFGSRQSFTASYVGSNGRRLLNLQEFSLSKLNPNFNLVEYPASGITSNYQALQLQFQRSVARGFQALASYSWSHALDFGSQSYNLPLQRGNADFDIRHNLQAGVSWDLPGLQGHSLVGQLVNGWGSDLRLIVRTGYPVMPNGSLAIDPATGSEYNGTLNLVANQPTYLYGSQYPGGRIINHAAFCLPSVCSGEAAPRNFVRGFGENQVNMAIRREFRLHDAFALQFRAEAFNILNHPNFGYIDPTYSDATFGQTTKMLNASLGTVASQYQQGGARSMQFALKLNF
ncbi:MAG: carboxypeptidase regulatory-like domain-containing protein [Acidobacteriaceae bacterium]|nr:carboxypeptidase regulatory-like domain-containing protein [Acidobacteriaceae bacterium]